MKRLLWILAFLICAVGPRPAFALVSISSSSATAGPRAALYLYPHETLTYKETGSFTGTINLEKSVDGLNYVGINISTTNNAAGGTFTGTVVNDDRGGYYRWNISTVTAGSFVSFITQNDDMVFLVPNLRRQAIMQVNDESVAVNGAETVAGTHTAATLKSTGDTTVGGYFYVQQSTAPRSATVGLTPSATYAMVINTTDNQVCISTGLTKNTWVQVAAPSSACSH